MAEEADSTAPAGHGMYLKDSAGDVQPVQTKDVDAKLQLGWKPASPGEVKDFQLQAKFGGFEQGAKAFGEGFGQTLSFGALTPIETGLFGVKPENIAGREEARSGLHLAGSLTAVAAPAIASLGSTLLPEAGAGAAELLGGAPGLISKAGEAASELAGEGVRGAFMGEAAGPLTLGQSVAQRAASMAAGSSVEGGLYSGAQVAHELALGDPNMTAQNAIEQIGLGTLLGGGIGSILGGANEVLPELVGRARDATAKAFGGAGKAIGKLYGSAEGVTGTSADVVTTMFEHRQEIASMAKLIPEVSETISNATPEMADWIVNNGGKLANYEQAFPGTTKMLSRVDPKTAGFLLDNWQKIITDPQARIDVATNLRTGIQDVLDTTNDILKKTNTEFAPNEARELIASAGPQINDTAKDAYANVMAKVDQAAKEMRAKSEAFSPAHASKLEELFDSMGRDAEAAGKNPAEAFERLRELRQQVGGITDWKAQPSDIVGRNTSNTLKSLYSDINGILRDPAAFGEAATRREALDAVQSEWMKLTGRGGEFRKSFLDAGGKVPSTRIDGWLNAMAKDKGVEAGEAWGKIMTLSRKIADEAEKSHRSGMVGEFDRAAADSLFDKTARLVDDAKLSGKATATQKYLSSGGMGIPNSGPVQPNAFIKAAQVAGQFAPNVVTNTFKTVTSVPRAIATLSALERIGQSMGKHIEAMAEMIARGEEDTVAGVAGSVGKDYLRDSAQDKVLERLERSASGVASEGGASLAERHLAEMHKLASSPELLSDRLDNKMLSEHAPQTTQALQMNLSRVIQHVTTKFPLPAPLGPLGKTPKMNKTDNYRLRSTLGTVSSPAKSIMRGIITGRLTPGMVSDAMAVAPEQMNNVKAVILGKISESKAPLPYARKMMLSMFLGQPMDPSMTPQAIIANQAVFNRPSQKSGQDQMATMGKSTQTGLAKLNVAGHSMLPGRAVESRRGEA